MDIRNNLRSNLLDNKTKKKGEKATSVYLTFYTNIQLSTLNDPQEIYFLRI